MTVSAKVRRRLALGLTGLTVPTLPLLAGARATVPAPCRTSQLVVWRGLPGSGAAGSVYYELQLSNVSNHTCSLSGFPSVSAVTSTGRALGRPATRDHAVAPTTVTLAPGATAHAVLRVTNVDVFSRAACRPVSAAGLAIRPPHQTKAAFVPFRIRVCAVKGPAPLSVQAVRPGVGIPGYSRQPG